MEENKTIDSNVEVEGGATETKEEIKTFTQDEVDKMISKRLQREKKDIEAKIEAERKEAEELAKLSEKEKQQKLFEKQVKEFEETKKAFERERLLNETSKQLASKNLPIDFAQMLMGDTAESTLENINAFESKFNEALEKMVTDRLRGKSPSMGTSSKSNVTKEEFNNMTYTERMNLYNTNKELFNQLNKQ